MLIVFPLIFTLYFLWSFDCKKSFDIAIEYPEFYKHTPDFSKSHDWAYLTYMDMVKGKKTINPNYKHPFYNPNQPSDEK